MVIALMASVVGSRPASAAAPGNDLFAQAQVLSGSLPVSVTGTNVDATKELGEPAHADNAGGASIWYSWTPTESGDVVIDTCGSEFDTLLAVYTGAAVDALTTIASNDDAGIDASCTVQSAVSFTAAAETTYHIAVDGYDGQQGAVTLSIRLATPPVVMNDHFAGAQILSGSPPQSVTGTTVEATREPGEPEHAGNAGGASIWYSWAPAESGHVTIEGCGSDFDTLLAVYTGATVNALSEIASNDDTCGLQSLVSFAAVAGTTYYIAVDGFDGQQGAVSLNLALIPAATNDDFAQAQVLSGVLPLQVTGSTIDATHETGESEHGGFIGGGSVWFSWTPTVSSSVMIETCGSAFDAHYGVYTGAAVDALTEIASNLASCELQTRVSFGAVAGTTYWIAVDGTQGQIGGILQGAFLLTIHPATAAANDLFTAAEVLSGPLPISVAGTTLDATHETGEPATGSASIWYSWTPSVSELVTIETCGSTIDTLLGIYTGTAVNALSNVTGDRAWGCSTQNRITFSAVGGTTYRIAVSGFHDLVQGDIELTIRPANPPINDAFANARVLRGNLPVFAAGTNVEATTEAGEPEHDGIVGGASVWFSWTPRASGPVTIETCGSAFDTHFGVYTGTGLDALTAVTSHSPRFRADNSCNFVDARLTFAATAGTTYWIAVDGFAGSQGAIALTIRVPNPPANDTFANAQTLSGTLPISTTGTNVDATHEIGEPPDYTALGHGASVWYTWTPSSAGPVTIETCGSAFGAILGVWTGAALDALTPVPSNNKNCGEGSTISFPAVAGTTYWISVDGQLATRTPQGAFQLRIRVANPPANDHFANAQVLSGSLPISATGSNFDATGEPDEPQHGPGEATHTTVWYRWTPSSSSMVVIETCGSNFDTLLAVYTGTTINALSESRVARGDDGCGRQTRVTFQAIAGTTYRIVVSGSFDQGDIALLIRAHDPPANDDFAGAQVLSGRLPISVTGTNVDATREAGEPEHPATQSPFIHAIPSTSVWYGWTPRQSGQVVIETCGSPLSRR
jgi:hypothetical protein